VPAQQYAYDTFKIKSSVLPNVIDFNKFHDAKAFKLSDANVNILFLGRLVPRKGCLVLLNAFTKIISDPEVRDVHLTICGKGPLEASLKRYVQEQQIEKFVSFKGYISEEDKPSYYAGADISVFPSLGGESFGIVLLEAMASGNAAVLAGNNPGYSSVMESRQDLLFNPNDAQSLTGLLKEFILRTSIRNDARNWGEDYSKNFDADSVGPKLLKIYIEALRKRTKQ
jgi:phosphatidylinositol alpha-mannosyltransferase